MKDLVCCTDSFVRALGGKSHYCPLSLLGISNLRSRTHHRENIVQIMRNTISTYLCRNMTFKQRRSCEHVFRSCKKKKKVSFEIFRVFEIFCNDHKVGTDMTPNRRGPSSCGGSNFVCFTAVCHI